MMTATKISCLLLVLSLAYSSAAWAEKPRATEASDGVSAKSCKRIKRKKKSKLPTVHTRMGRRWMFMMPMDLDLAIGTLDGYRTLPDQRGPFGQASVGLTPTLRWRRGIFLMRAPLALARRQPIAHEVQWTRASGGLNLDGKVADGLRVASKTSVGVKSMPGLPDPYQPIVAIDGRPTGRLNTTDRHGYWSVTAAGEVGWRPAGDTGATEWTLGGDFDQRIFNQDPAFDPILRPNHLTPGDRHRYGAEVGVRTTIKRWGYRARFKARVSKTDFHFILARDADTGLTHGAPGDPPANPTARFVRTSLSHRSSLWLRRFKTRVFVDLRYTSNDDRFAGYYSWSGPRIEPGLRVRPAKGWKLEVSAAAETRQFTSDGYLVGTTHPPLDGGDSIRAETRLSARARVSFRPRSTPWLTTWFKARAKRRDTNFPNYVPGVFPEDSAYDIDFDTSELSARLGASASF